MPDNSTAPENTVDIDYEKILQGELRTRLQKFPCEQVPTLGLLVRLGNNKVVKITQNEVVSCPDLSPPIEWYDQGAMNQIDQHGNTMGYIWLSDKEVADKLNLLRFGQQIGHLIAGFNLDLFAETRKIVTQLPTATACLDNELCILAVNRDFASIFNTAPYKIENQSLESVVLGSAAYAILKTHLERVIGGARQQFVWEYGDKLLECSASHYAGSTKSGVLLTIHDVTEERNRERVNDALTQAEHFMAVFDEKGQVLFQTQGFANVMGEDAQCKPFWEFSAWDDEERVTAKKQWDTLAIADTAEETYGKRKMKLRRAGESILLEQQLAEESALGQIAALSHPFLLLSPSGLVKSVSESALHLIDAPANLVLQGQFMVEALEKVGYHIECRNLQPFPKRMREIKESIREEVTLTLPSGARRDIEIAVERMPSTNDLFFSLTDLTKVRYTQAKLQHDTTHDSLTGLPNMAGFRRVIQEAKGGGLGLVEIREFARLSAALDPTSLNGLLIEVAARLKSLGGFPARLHDNHFALYLPELTADEVVEQLQDVLELPFRISGKKNKLIPSSKGQLVVLFDIASSDQSGSNLVNDAELALKRARRKREPVVFVPEFRQEEARLFELETDLRSAAQNNELSLVYQPAIDLSTGQRTMAEALLRWQHPRYGFVSPAEFLALATTDDTILSLGEWVVREAIDARQSLLDCMKDASSTRLSVNFSLDELIRIDGVEHLLPPVKAYPLDIEVPMRSFVDYTAQTLEVMQQLKKIGCRIIVDDFGQKHTNLKALRDLEPYALKIHGSLIKQLHDPKTAKLLAGAVKIAHSLDMRVTAAGIETLEALQMLRDMGVDEAQGFLISQPLTLTELQQWTLPDEIAQLLSS